MDKSFNCVNRKINEDFSSFSFQNSNNARNTSTTDEIKIQEEDISYRDVPSSGSSVYRPTTTPRRSISNFSKFLDWLSLCLWKCSPTCQKIK